MKAILTALLILVATTAQAQCVAEVKDVLIDEARGSIIIETQYKLNGVVVDVKANPDPKAIGRTRYTEESGTIAEIVTKAKADVQQHCENLIVRHAVAVNGLNKQKLVIQKALTEPLIATLKTNAVGWKKTVTDKTITFKGKTINVKADGTYTINSITE